MVYHEVLYVEIDEEPFLELEEELVSLEVELDTELAGHFRLRLRIALQRDGRWTSSPGRRCA